MVKQPVETAVTRATARDVSRVLPIGRPRSMVLAALIVTAAAWGIIVDSPTIPLLAPTGNSTFFQSTTAAAFALIGIFFGPVPGALGGLVRDGTGALLVVITHPALIRQPGFLPWIGRTVVDILEDVVLGLVPGLVALRFRRVSVLAATSAVTAWLSLPFLVVGSLVAYGQFGQILPALTSRPGDWNEPVDPALTVYALLTGAFVAVVLAARVTRPRRALAIGAGYAALALVLIVLGAHP